MDWGLLALSMLLGFLVFPLNAAEYRLSARLAGSDVPFADAVHTTVLASALNVLPLPAGAMVRFQGIRESGATGRTAARATGATGAIWLATSSLAAAVALVTSGRLGLGAVFALICFVATALTFVLLRTRPVSSRWLASIVTVEVGFVALAAIRFHLTVSALGVSISTVQAIVVATSSALASATGVLPGSIGIFEVLAAGLAAATDLPASSGFLATTLLRVMAAMSAGLAALVLARSGPPIPQQPSPHTRPDS